MSATLLRDGAPLAPAEVAATRRSRRRGLIGRSGIEGALVLRPCRQVHTFGVRFPIDVASCRSDGRVLHVARLVPRRVGRPALRAAFAVEAEAGAFARWGVRVGSRLTVAEDRT